MYGCSKDTVENTDTIRTKLSKQYANRLLEYSDTSARGAKTDRVL